MSTGLSSRLSDFCCLSSLPCFHLLTAFFCWLSPSLDSYLKSTGLFCPTLSTDSLCLVSDIIISSTSGLAGDLILRPFVWVSRQNRQRDRLSGAKTNVNELLRIVSRHVFTNPAIWAFYLFVPNTIVKIFTCLRVLCFYNCVFILYFLCNHTLI